MKILKKKKLQKCAVCREEKTNIKLKVFNGREYLICNDCLHKSSKEIQAKIF